jgi:hypothetical protein
MNYSEEYEPAYRKYVRAVNNFAVAMQSMIVSLFESDKNSEEEKNIKMLCLLCLVDGAFLSVLSSNYMQNVTGAITVGLLFFSGPGAITGFMAVNNNLKNKVALAGKIYLISTVVAMVTVIFAPILVVILSKNLKYLSAVIIISIAFFTSGHKKLANLGVRDLRPLLLITIFIFVVERFMENNLTIPSIQINPNIMLFSFIATTAGFIENTVAAIVSSRLGPSLNVARFRYFASAGLFTIALALIGVPVPASIPFLILIVGIVLSWDVTNGLKIRRFMGIDNRI